MKLNPAISTLFDSNEAYGKTYKTLNLHRPNKKLTKNVDHETMKKRKKSLIWSKIRQKSLFAFIVFSSFFKYCLLYSTVGQNLKNDCKTIRFFDVFLRFLICFFWKIERIWIRIIFSTIYRRVSYSILFIFK